MAKTWNRARIITIEDILDMFRTLSGAGHPDDYVGEKARIRYCRFEGKLCAYVEWQGVPVDDPEYDGNEEATT